MATASTATTISRDAASQTTDIEAKQSPVAARRKLKRKGISGALAGSSGKDELKNNNVSWLGKNDVRLSRICIRTYFLEKYFFYVFKNLTKQVPVTVQSTYANSQ